MGARVKALVAVVTLAYSAASVKGDLIGYWDFEGSAADRSAHRLDGTLVGDAFFDADTPAPIGGATSIRLDGEGDWIALGNPSELNFTSNDWTVAGWMKTTRAGLGDENEGTLFGNGGDWQGGIRYTIVLSEGNIEGVPTLVIDDNAAAPGSAFNKQVLVARTPVNDGLWHHVAGVRDAGQMRIYIDGELEGTAVFNAAYDLTGLEQHPAYIGAITDNRDGTVFKLFEGNLDDVAVWNQPLTSSEIGGLANGTLSPLNVPEPSSIAMLLGGVFVVYFCWPPAGRSSSGPALDSRRAMEFPE